MFTLDAPAAPSGSGPVPRVAFAQLLIPTFAAQSRARRKSQRPCREPSDVELVDGEALVADTEAVERDRIPYQVRCVAVRSRVAGPSSSVPSGAKREPCSGHSQALSASFQFTIPPRCGQTGEIRYSAPATRHLASRCQGGPLTTPPSSSVGLRRPVRTNGAIRPFVRGNPTSGLEWMAVRRPESSCGLQLANARDQSIRPPRIWLVNANAAAAPFVIPHLLKPVAI